MGGGMVAMGLVLLLLVAGLVLLILFLRRSIDGNPERRIREGALRRIDMASAVPVQQSSRAANGKSGEIEGSLVIPDISGYTQFMRMSAFALAHAQFAVSALLNSMINAAEGVLATAKIEGDAVLLYGAASQEGREGLTGPQVGEAVRNIVQAFYRTRAELLSANACPCEACAGVDGLEVKTVVHSGRLLLYELRGEQELSGLPVIVAHRLLKSDVGHERYVLITDAAEPLVTLQLEATRARHIQNYEGVGEVGSTVYAFDPDQLPTSDERFASGVSAKAADAARKLAEGLRALR